MNRGCRGSRDYRGCREGGGLWPQVLDFRTIKPALRAVENRQTGPSGRKLMQTLLRSGRGRLTSFAAPAIRRGRVQNVPFADVNRWSHIEPVVIRCSFFVIREGVPLMWHEFLWGRSSNGMRTHSPMCSFSS